MNSGADRRERILAFIRSYIEKNGFAPSVVEIGAGTDISSTSVVNFHVDRLVAAGKLRKVPRRARALAVVPDEAPA